MPKQQAARAALVPFLAKLRARDEAAARERQRAAEAKREAEERARRETARRRKAEADAAERKRKEGADAADRAGWLAAIGALLFTRECRAAGVPRSRQCTHCAGAAPYRSVALTDMSVASSAGGEPSLALATPSANWPLVMSSSAVGRASAFSSATDDAAE